MVAYETTPQKKAEEAKKKEQEKKGTYLIILQSLTFIPGVSLMSHRREAAEEEWLQCRHSAGCLCWWCHCKLSIQFRLMLNCTVTVCLIGTGSCCTDLR